jgi:2-oxo-4-hydroxy-4-carboxy-5-ureidoimidazoline decarboxylase
VTVSELNRAGRDDFTNAVGFAFENSPWIAAEAWEKRPFASVEDMHAAMVAVVEGAPEEKRIALIAAHPDLAGRVAREGRLTAASADEQSSAGLDRLSKEELVRFERLNDDYRARFSFPFVICARENTKGSILSELERRAQNDRAAEVATALREIAKIARLRLADAVTNDVVKKWHLSS